MKSTLKQKHKSITAEEFDSKFDNGEDITQYLDSKKATVIRRVNVDFPDWMVQRLDEEAQKLNISRQAVVKTWIYAHLVAHH
jgi:hypothetical protein